MMTKGRMSSRRKARKPVYAPQPYAARPYVTHEAMADGLTPLCTPQAQDGLPPGHLLADKRGGPVTCNRCQRQAWLNAKPRERKIAGMEARP